MGEGLASLPTLAGVPTPLTPPGPDHVLGGVFFCGTATQLTSSSAVRLLRVTAMWRAFVAGILLWAFIFWLFWLFTH